MTANLAMQIGSHHFYSGFFKCFGKPISYEVIFMTLNSHPALPEFEYIRPATLAEASHFLSLHPDTARPFLGGTDVFVRMRDGFLCPEFLVDVKNLDGTNQL